MAICAKCGETIPGDVKFCTFCGSPVSAAGPEASPEPAAEPAAESAATVTAVAEAAAEPPRTETAAAPEPAEDKHRAVVSTGNFVLLEFLFAIPVIGWLICLIMAFAAKNLNRKHFARSKLIWLAVFLVTALVIALVLKYVLAFLSGWVTGWASGVLSNPAVASALEGLSGLDLSGLDISGLDISGLNDLLGQLGQAAA